MSHYLVRGGHVVTDARLGPAGLIADGAVLTDGDRIAAVGRYADLKAKHPQVEEIGSTAHLVMPGLVDADTHGYGVSYLQRGLLDDSLELWHLAQSQLRPLEPYLDTLYGMARLSLSGVTTAIYSQWHTGPHESYRAAANASLRACDEVGLRVAMALSVANRFHLIPEGDEALLTLLPPELAARAQTLLAPPDMIKPEEYLVLFDEMLEVVRVQYPRARLLLGPAATHWLTDEFWRAIAAKAQQHSVAVRIHMDESYYDHASAPMFKGQSSVAYLKDMGVLTERASLIHSVWLNDDDLRQIKEVGATVVHLPSCNLRLRNGIAPVNAMWQAGINVALGMDSTSLNDDDDILQEMGLCALLHRTPGLDTFCLKHYDVLTMATVNGARSALMLDEIGTLEVGKKADITVVDLTRAPYTDPEQDPVALLIGRTRGRDVDTTLVDGQVVVRGGRHTRVNLDDVAARQRAYFEKVGTRNLDVRGIVDEIRPYLLAYYQQRYGQPGRPSQPYYVMNSRI